MHRNLCGLHLSLCNNSFFLMAQPPSSTDDIIEPFRQVHLKPQWNKGPPEIAFPRFKIDTEKAVFGMRVANSYSEGTT